MKRHILSVFLLLSLSTAVAGARSFSTAEGASSISPSSISPSSISPSSIAHSSIAPSSISPSSIASDSTTLRRPPFDRSLIPEPVFDAEPGYIELYWKAWEFAYDHLKLQEGLVQPLYMDEGLWDDTIWIWDSEFMVMFCKYAPALYPGIQTLDNFYYTMLENSGSSLRIQHPDNPPFFAWVENDYYKFTGDREHLRSLLLEKRFLQRYWDWFNALRKDIDLPFDHAPIAVKYIEGMGYRWNGVSSGMDNTPRMRGGDGMLWVDAISQQALSALYISRLARIVGDRATEREFRKRWRSFRDIVNKYYWDDSLGCYFDIVPEDAGPQNGSSEGSSVGSSNGSSVVSSNGSSNGFSVGSSNGSSEGSGKGVRSADGKLWKTTGVLTPASFWPLLARIPSREQAAREVEYALSPSRLGGKVPWTTVSRDDREFNSVDGHYWTGSVWLPTAYVGIKALEEYNFCEAADTTAQNVLDWMLRTYREYTPHTIWECYSPSAPVPGRNYSERVRPDFCGWSALGPISLFIENVIGIREVDADSATLRWDVHQKCRHGVRRLRFGKITTDLIYDPATGSVSVTSDSPYKLILNGKSHRIKAGENKITVK